MRTKKPKYSVHWKRKNPLKDMRFFDVFDQFYDVSVKKVTNKSIWKKFCQLIHKKKHKTLRIHIGFELVRLFHSTWFIHLHDKTLNLKKHLRNKSAHKMLMLAKCLTIFCEQCQRNKNNIEISYTDKTKVSHDG